MSLKGIADIYLTDVKTNEVQHIKEENMFTDALQNILDGIIKGDKIKRAISGVSRGSEYCPNFKGWLEAITPLHKGALSGVLLFDQKLDEQKTNIIKKTDIKNIGYAGRNLDSVPDNPLMGTFNQAASGVTEDGKGYKFVWEFNTSQANGTINSIALTSEMGGQAGYSVPPSSTTPHLFTIQNLISIAGNTSDSSFLRLPYNLTTARKIFNFSIDPASNAITIKYLKYINTTTVEIRKYIYNKNYISLNEQYNERSIKNDILLKRIVLPIAIHGGELDVGVVHNSSSNLVIIGTTYYHYYVYDLDKETILFEHDREYTSPNVYTGFCFKNELFISHGDSIDRPTEKYNIETKEITTLDHAYGAFAVFNKELYANGYIGSDTYRLAKYNEVTGTFDITDNNRVTEWDRTYFALNDLVQLTILSQNNWANEFYLYYFAPYLATINNLSQPIKKDDNKTLKIVYTVTETEELIPATV